MTKKQIFLSLVFISFLYGCSQTANKTSEQNLSANDTTFYFVKRILNVSPKVVEQILGKPDKPFEKLNDCDPLPYCNEANYQDGKITIDYYNNLSKIIMINEVSNMTYDNNMIGRINFPNSVPTFVSQKNNVGSIMTFWRNNPNNKEICKYDGINEIWFKSKDQDSSDRVASIYIQIDKDYNKKFEVINEQEIAKSNNETQKQAEIESEKTAERKELIEKQFITLDGSNKYVSEAIKKNMNDPSSYKHISTKYFDLKDHIKVITEFSGTNKLGAVVKNTVIAQVSLDGEILEIKYNK